MAAAWHIGSSKAFGEPANHITLSTANIFNHLTYFRRPCRMQVCRVPAVHGCTGARIGEEIEIIIGDKTAAGPIIVSLETRRLPITAVLALTKTP